MPGLISFASLTRFYSRSLPLSFTAVALAATIFLSGVSKAQVVSGSAAHYYVDAVNGSDMNVGTSASSPLRTIAKVNTLQLAPGSSVSFHAGQEWHETLNVTKSGLSSSPITFSAYGTGSQPIISAADNVQGWSQGSAQGAAESCTLPAFCSGFETASLKDWTKATADNDAIISIATSPVSHGSGALAISNSLGIDTRAFVTKTIPSFSSGVQYAFRFYLLTPVGSLRANRNFRVLELLNGNKSVGFASIYTDGSGNVRSLSFYDTADGNSVIVETPLSGYTMGAWNEIELNVTPSASSGSGALYVNGVQQGVTLTNSALPSWIGINQFTLGNTAWGSAIAPGQTVYFDDVKATASTSPVGFASVGTPSPIWFTKQSTDPKLINFGGQAGLPVNDSSLLSTANQFVWQNSLLYVYSTSNPSSLVEVPARSSAVTSAGASYITFSGLEFRGGQTYNVYCGNSSASCDHWDFEGDTFNAGYSNELYLQPYPGTNPAFLTVRQCTFKGGGANGIALSGPGATGAYIVNNTFFDLSKIYNTAYSQNTWSDAIEGYSSDSKDGAGTYIGYNNIHDIGVGQSADYGGGIHPDSVNGWTIEGNTVQNTNSAGIQLEKGSFLSARYNLIVNGGTKQYGAGLLIRAGEGISVSAADVENNTSFGGWWACSMLIQQNGGYVTLRNSTFRKNICVGASSETQLYTDAGANDSTNVIGTNAYGSAYPYYLVLGYKVLTSYSDLMSLFNFGTDNVAGDPLFTNVSAGLFTLQAASPARGLGAFPNP